jgi:hypothetical protein
MTDAAGPEHPRRCEAVNTVAKGDRVNLLAALPRPHEAPVRVFELFRRLGVERPTNSQRASLSRSLARLEARGLVERWGAGRCLEGHGSFWRRTE